MNSNRLKVTLMRSRFGISPNQAACLLGLGLKRIRQVVDLEDTPSIRGMIKKVWHLVSVEEV